jgi:hypothetical protein
MMFERSPADLHDFGEDGFVEVVLQSGGTEVSLEHILLFVLETDHSQHQRQDELVGQNTFTKFQLYE